MRSIFAFINLKTKKGFSVLFTVLLFAAAINFIGCETKKGEEPAVNIDSIKAVVARQIADSIETAEKTKQIADSIALAEKNRVPDMVGKWTGTLDGRATTLTIKEQTGNKFTGTIVINYRQVATKAVAGTINIDTKKITMRDTQKFRYAGTYSGNFSAETNKFSGSFTVTADNQSFPFSLTKK